MITFDFSDALKELYICRETGASDAPGGEDESSQSPSAATSEKAVAAATGLLWGYRHAYSH